MCRSTNLNRILAEAKNVFAEQEQEIATIELAMRFADPEEYSALSYALQESRDALSQVRTHIAVLEQRIANGKDNLHYRWA